MLTVLLLMASGILLGLLLPNSPRIKSIIDRLTLYTMYLLLGIMGFSIGTNKTLLEKLPALGFQAVVITFGAVTGSVVMGWIAYWLFYKAKH